MSLMLSNSLYGFTSAVVKKGHMGCISQLPGLPGHRQAPGRCHGLKDLELTALMVTLRLQLPCARLERPGLVDEPLLLE